MWGKVGGFLVWLEETLSCLARRGSPFQPGCRPVPQFPSLLSERLSSERGVTRTISSPLPKPWGLGWLRLSPRGWLWGAHVSLCPIAGSALLPFKPPSKGFPVLPDSGPGLLMPSRSQPRPSARSLPPAHHPGVGAAWRRAPQPQGGSSLAPLHKEGCTAPGTSLPSPRLGGGLP